MKRKQADIYSLVEDHGSGFAGEAQKPAASRELEETLQHHRNGQPSQGKPLESGNLPEPSAASEPRRWDSKTTPGFMEEECCPRCQQEAMVRLRRRQWMHWLPRTSYCLCLECKTRFLLAGRLKIKLPQGKGLKKTVADGD